MPYDYECDEIAAEAEQLRDDIDTIINDIGEIIIGIADGNTADICSECIETAKSLWRIMEDHAREEDEQDILEQFAYKTGVSLNDD